MKNRNIGSKVKTIYGKGTIIGIDLPESRAWRYIVRLDCSHKILVFFKKEIEIIFNKKTLP